MVILVIEDHLEMRKMVRRMLEGAGHEVVDAENGRAGIAAANARRFDALVTDIIMPEMEGIETIRDIRARQPRLPIVAMSGGGQIHQDDLLRMAQLLGADEILAKPFVQDALLAAIARAIDSRSSDRDRSG